MQIWKWGLSPIDLQSLAMPDGAKPLALQMQNGEPQLWAVVDETAPLVHRHFATYGTGQPMPEGNPGQYIGTYQLRDGALVFHVFEVD